MGRSRNAATTGASGRHGVPWRAAGLLVVAVLLIAGFVLVREGLGGTGARPPQPPAGARPGAADTRPGPELTVPEELLAPAVGLPPAEPVLLSVPRIDVTAPVMRVGLEADGTVGTPPLDQADRAGWYERGPTPGEPGNAVIVGHLDSEAVGEAVFFELGALRPGDAVDVLRQDRRVARFVVDRVESHAKDAFPHEAVYGPASEPQLRLVTCGGDFDEETGDYPENIIVFASLAE